MQCEDIVAMFEAVMTRDGSVFKLNMLEPMSFGGQKGFRFGSSRLPGKVDSVEPSGVGFGTVANGEPYAMLYAAPELGSSPATRAVASKWRAPGSRCDPRGDSRRGTRPRYSTRRRAMRNRRFAGLGLWRPARCRSRRFTRPQPVAADFSGKTMSS